MFIDTPIGSVKIDGENNKVTTIMFCERRGEEKSSEFLRECAQEIEEFFNRRREGFSFSVNPCGTEFQRKVWMEMMNIPYGETVSYSVLAERIGMPEATRAVANACGKNPIVIAIPCHRVICKDGSLGGFSCGISRKVFLLDIEKNKN